MKKILLLAGWILISGMQIFAQPIVRKIGTDPDNPFYLAGFELPDSNLIRIQKLIPLFSVVVDNHLNELPSNVNRVGDTLSFIIADSLQVRAYYDNVLKSGVRCVVRFINIGKVTHQLENLVPCGEKSDHVYITASGSKEWPEYLCRSKLFRPGYGPVGVVLPDNAWHLGFSDVKAHDSLSLTALARRGQRDKERTEIDRWAVKLKPGGWVDYSIYFNCHKGDWHEGLKMMFQEYWLYDLTSFDNSLYKRTDLAWMKNCYLMLLQFAWDKKYFNYQDQKYTFYENLFEYDSLTGGYDIFTLWPTWPRLGLDQRNQWDMYRDLPGGLKELHKQVEFTHQAGKKYFISFNPWDEGTRKEEQLKGMEELLRETNADGVVLDTKGSSSFELQATADKVKPGIIMYSEGMAVPRDMPGIVTGRVHDALVMPPPLNLNKLIKPDFAIFRVLQLADDRLHRELAISFFNGYGVEINTMRPGRPSWMKEELSYLGRTTRILRENNSVFTNGSFYPLVSSMIDSVYVNSWESTNKKLYTIYSARPSGWHGKLFEISPNLTRSSPLAAEKTHIVDLWNHKEIKPVLENDKAYLNVDIEAFDVSWLHTRREGSVGCIGIFEIKLYAKLAGSKLHLKSATEKPGRIVVFVGNPSYQNFQYVYNTSDTVVDIREYLKHGGEKIVVQLFQETELIDEVILPVLNNSPLLISHKSKTDTNDFLPQGMVNIPAGMFRFYTRRNPESQEPFIPLPDYHDTVVVQLPRFFIDKYPVTNQDYYRFICATNYQPADTSKFLHHWKDKRPVPGSENFPVVYVNQDDANAFARWAGKRLPTEQEWQYAAQGSDCRKYPWGNLMDSLKCNFNLNHPTSVSDYLEGASPFGVIDLVGNVWQMTADIYDNGSYYFNIIRGGSYYHPTQSVWYVTGGPQPVDHPEMLLLISPGLDRNATIGFRCVKESR